MADRPPIHTFARSSADPQALQGRYAQGVYVFLFLKELWHLIHTAPSFTEQSIMLIVLGLIDVVMISNLQ